MRLTHRARRCKSGHPHKFKTSFSQLCALFVLVIIPNMAQSVDPHSFTPDPMQKARKLLCIERLVASSHAGSSASTPRTPSIRYKYFLNMSDPGLYLALYAALSSRSRATWHCKTMKRANPAQRLPCACLATLSAASSLALFQLGGLGRPVTRRIDEA